MEFCYFCGGKPDHKATIDGQEVWVCQKCQDFWAHESKLLKGKEEIYISPPYEKKTMNFCYFCGGTKNLMKIETNGKKYKTFQELWSDVISGNAQIERDVILEVENEKIVKRKAPRGTIYVCKTCNEKHKPKGTIIVEDV